MNYVLTLTADEFALIFNTIAELPARTSRLLLNKLQDAATSQELDMQQQSREAAVAELEAQLRQEQEARDRAAMPMVQEIVTSMKDPK